MEKELEKATFETIEKKINNCESDLGKLLKISKISDKITLPNIKINFDKLVSDEIQNVALEVKKLTNLLKELRLDASSTKTALSEVNHK